MVKKYRQRYLAIQFLSDHLSKSQILKIIREFLPEESFREARISFIGFVEGIAIIRCSHKFLPILKDRINQTGKMKVIRVSGTIRKLKKFIKERWSMIKVTRES